MEAYRDFVRDYLDALPDEGERCAMEDQLHPPIYSLTQETHELGIAAQKAGIIDKQLSYDIGMVGVSLVFVSVQSKVICEDPFYVERPWPPVWKKK